MKPDRKTIVILLVLTAVVIAGFGHVVRFGFVNLDDGLYVYENRRVLDGFTKPGIAWAWSNTDAANWHPLTWLSLMLDAEIYGARAGGYHLTNLLLHLANTWLVFFTLTRMTGAPWKSALVAALFAVHPLHVESVAWVSERKDVLSTCFGLLALAAYIRYTETSGKEPYLLCMVLLTLSLLSKAMLVTLPFVFLLLDVWPLGRWAGGGLAAPAVAASRPEQRTAARLILEKLPLLLPVALISAVTVLAQQGKGALGDLAPFSLAVRAANAAVSYVAYLGKTVWPVSLSVYYPHPGATIPAWKVLGACLLLLGMTALVLRLRRSRPYLMVGWFWYVGTLVPVIGIVQVGSQAMADRYTYMPLVGIFIAAVWGLAEVGADRRNRRLALGAVAVALVGLLTGMTRVQAGHWKNNETLYSRAIAVDPANDLAHGNLADALAETGDVDRAISHYRTSLRLNPTYAQAANNLANLLLKTGRPHEAEGLYRQAMAADQKNPAYPYNLGILMAAQGRPEAAFDVFSEALRRDPMFVEAYNHTGLLMLRQGNRRAARRFFRQALDIRPDFAPARENMARYGLTDAEEHTGRDRTGPVRGDSPSP